MSKAGQLLDDATAMLDQADASRGQEQKDFAIAAAQLVVEVDLGMRSDNKEYTRLLALEKRIGTDYGCCGCVAEGTKIVQRRGRWVSVPF